MPNDQSNGFASRFYMTTPVEGGDPITEYYDIEALRLVDSTSRNPVSVGDSTHPVYFLEGVPQQCSGGTGGGGGGSDVGIYPKYKGGTLIANFSIDGQNGRLYSPSVAEVYKKVTLWPPAGASGSYYSEVGDNNDSNPFKTMISNYEFLLIHYAPTNNLSEERTMMLDAQVLKDALPSNAIFSCHYLSNVFIKCQFTSQDKFQVIESEGIPLTNAQEPAMLKCAIKKIEGLQFGTSGEDLDQGLTVKQVLWEGTASQTGTFTFKTGTVESFNYIYLHCYASNNQYEERILVLDQEAIIEGLAQQPSSQAYFTCDILDDLYIKGKFIDTNKFTITEVHTKTIDGEIVVPVLSQIDGICMGSVGTITAEGGDTSDCMKKGIDYVTAGAYWPDDNTVHLQGDRVTAEGYLTEVYANYAHAEGYGTSVYSVATHAEGYNNYVDAYMDYDEPDRWAYIGAHVEGTESTVSGRGAHAEGYSTNAYGTAAHAEGSNTIVNGFASHAEGERTTVEGPTSHVEGYEAYVSGYYCHAEGFGSSACGYNAHAEGYRAYADSGAHAEGYETCGTFGYHSTVYGAHVEGCHTFLDGPGGHAEGCGTSVINHYQDYNYTGHAEGYHTISYNGAHVEGFYNKAGTQTTFASNVSHVGGFGNVASIDGYFEDSALVTYIIGKYNINRGNNAINYPFVIGNGTATNARYGTDPGYYDPDDPDTNVSRSDAVLIDWQGNITAPSISQGSSRKIKENIQDMSKQEAEKLLQLRPVSFDYIEGEGDKDCYGLIAEEVQDAELNYPLYEGRMKSKDEECLQLDYSKFVPYLIKMIQIQDERISKLEQELEERKGVK